MEEKVWDVPGKAGWEQQWFRSAWREAPVYWMPWGIKGIKSSFFPMLSQSTQWSGINVCEWCLLIPQSVNNLASNLNHDAWRRKTPPDWLKSGLQTSLCRVLKVLEMKVLLWVKKITKKSDCLQRRHTGK